MHLQANSRSKRDFFAERRSDGVSEPMSFQKKSRRERYIVRDDVVDWYGVELLGHCLFFKFAPLVAAVQHFQHDPGSKAESADEHLALAQIVQL